MSIVILIPNKINWKMSTILIPRDEKTCLLVACSNENIKMINIKKFGIKDEELLKEDAEFAAMIHTNHKFSYNNITYNICAEKKKTKRYTQKQMNDKTIAKLMHDTFQSCYFTEKIARQVYQKHAEKHKQNQTNTKTIKVEILSSEQREKELGKIFNEPWMRKICASSHLLKSFDD